MILRARLAVAASALLLAACSGTSAHQGLPQAYTPTPSPVSSPTSVPGDADDVDPCASPNTTVTRRAPAGGPLVAGERVEALGPYVGEWHVHGQYMVMRSNGVGSVDGSGTSYSIHATRYRSPDRLLVRVTAAEYYDAQTGKWVTHPSDPCTLADGLITAGDSSILQFVAPHLLRETPFISHLAPDEIKGNGGNPYWCGTGLARRYLDKCGA